MQGRRIETWPPIQMAVQGLDTFAPDLCKGAGVLCEASTVAMFLHGAREANFGVQSIKQFTGDGIESLKRCCLNLRDRGHIAAASSSPSTSAREANP